MSPAFTILSKRSCLLWQQILKIKLALSTAKRYREINHIGLNTLIDKAYQLVMAAKYFMGGIICAEKFHCLV